MHKLNSHRIVTVLMALVVISCVSNDVVRVRHVAPNAISSSDAGTCDPITRFFKTDLDPYWIKIDNAWEDYLHEKSSTSSNARKLFTAYQKLRDDEVLLAQTARMEASTRSVVPESCPDRPRLVRALELLKRSILTQNVQSKEVESELLYRDIVRKNASFTLSLPGDKTPLSVPAFFNRLGSVEDRRSRENLASLFLGARSKKWMEWGFRELIKARNDEATAAGFANYVQYQLSKIGWSNEDYQAAMARVRERWSVELKNKFQAWGKNIGISNLQFSDVPAFVEAGTTQLLEEGSKNVLSDFPPDGINWLCTALAMPFVTPSGNRNDDPFWVGIIKQWQVSEERPSHAFFETIEPLEAKSMGYAISEMVFQPSFLNRWSELSTRKATVVGRTLVVDPTNLISPPLYRLITAVMRSELETQIYAHPDEDFGELWSKIVADYWGVELQPFYADWDDDAFLDLPGSSAGRLLATLVGHAIAGGLSEQFPPGCCSRSMGDRMRQVGFTTGREYDYSALLLQLGGKEAAASKLVDTY